MTTAGFTNIIDASTDVPMRIDYVHHEIHAGATYLVWDSSTDTDTTPIRIKLDVPQQAKRIHLLATINVSGACTYSVTENPTGGASGGSSFTPINIRRDKGENSTVTVTTGVTAPTGGTKIIGPFNFGDRGIAAASRDDGEWVLGSSDQATTYVYEITSTTNSILSNILLRWYEHTDKNPV